MVKVLVLEVAGEFMTEVLGDVSGIAAYAKATKEAYSDLGACHVAVVSDASDEAAAVAAVLAKRA